MSNSKCQSRKSLGMGVAIRESMQFKTTKLENQLSITETTDTNGLPSRSLLGLVPLRLVGGLSLDPGQGTPSGWLSVGESHAT